MNDGNSGAERKYHQLDYDAALGPQALNSMLLGSTLNNYDKEKNDVYGIGITILSGLNNDDFNTYYDWNSNVVRFDLVNDRISRLSTEFGYTHNLVSVMRKMLDQDEFTRIEV